MEHPVEAQVIDSRHLKLKKPIQNPPGSKVMITIEPAEAIAEDQSWYTLSAGGLQAAYGEDEPDYSLERIKIPNPEFQP
ncbi:MAG TPA: hypothetical protein VI755_16070 [Anaerolineales bacterium]|nr:hypothetical protein [Anaerolineales bacterium]